MKALFSTGIDRRVVLKSLGSVIGLAAAAPGRSAYDAMLAPQTIYARDSQSREILKSFLFTREDVDRLLIGNTLNYISRKYHPILGYVFVNCRFANGMDNSLCTYTYQPTVDLTPGPRRMLSYADVPCRINTYGDSFTHGDQVSDGETWQERLAAHLGEPIRNFGVGNYSVYQAYLRMNLEEARRPSEYIIFTIYDDDHRRSLQPLMPGWGIRPYIAADSSKGLFIEHSNPCPTPHSLYNLCDIDWLYSNFHEYALLSLEKYSDRGVAPAKLSEMFAQFYYGLTPTTCTNAPALVKDALFGSECLVKKIQSFVTCTHRKIIYVLAYGTVRLRELLVSGRRFDQSFVSFLHDQGFPLVDLGDLHLQDFRMFNVGADDYLKRYFVGGTGHYNPMGNAFMAFAIKSKLLPLLAPQPPAYMR